MGERRAALIIIATIVIVVGLVLAWVFAPSAQNPAPAAPISEVTDVGAIQQHVQLSRPGLATSENYFGHKIRLVLGSLKNVSDRPIRLVEVKMVFTDYDGKPIQEHIEKTFESAQKPLAPGAEHRFEVGFENLPKEWNYRVPVMEITKIGY
jgi:hypothetical protein